MLNNWNDDKNFYWKRIAKRTGAIVLSAVLFGGTAGAAFQGVSYLTKSNTKTTASDASNSNGNFIPTTNVEGSGNTNSQSLDVSDIAAGVMPSIVSITNKSVQEVQEFYGMFGTGNLPAEQETESSGSGIIIGQNDSEVLIATNNHVVEGAKTLSVSFVDNQVYEAQIKGTDSTNDLAVIAVPVSNISSDTMSEIEIAKIGDSESLKVGQQVVAIGNALGYGQSVTTGIVSALNRKIDDSADSPSLIQTDAAINPGNSGGALINMNGEVIGINSAKFASTEVEGMGYAIPVATASPIMDNLMSRTTREKVASDQASSMGISGNDVSSEIEKEYGLPLGVYVVSVEQGSAAQKAGLKEGNVITKFDGTSISSMSDLKEQLQYYAAGESVEMTVKVANNGAYEEKQVEITLDAAKTTSSSENSGSENSQSGSAGNGQQAQGNSGLGDLFGSFAR